MSGVLVVAIPIGAAIAWLSLAGPGRARVVVGFGLASATVGFVAGAVACVVLFDQGPPDGTGTLVLTWALAAAGIGWIAGAVLGALVTSGASSPGSRDAWILRATACLVVLAGLATVRFLGTTVMHGRATVDHPGAELRFLPAAQVATLADAAIVALSLLLLAGVPRREAPASEERRPVGSGVRRLGTAGLVVGTLAVAMTGWVAEATRSGQDTATRTRATARTVDDLLRAAEDYRLQTGEYPGDLTVLTSFGGRVAPGTVVRYAGPFREGSFCVRVGTADGEGGIGPPFYSGIVNADPRRHGHTSQGAWVGDGCHAP